MDSTDKTVKKCINCGRELPEGASFCPYCETSQLEVRTAPVPVIRRRRPLYALLAACFILIAAAVMLPKVLDGATDEPQTQVEVVSAAELVELAPAEPGPTETEPAVTMAALRKVEEPEAEAMPAEPESEAAEQESEPVESEPVTAEPKVTEPAVAPEPQPEPAEPAQAAPEPEPEPAVTREPEPADEPAVTGPEPVEASQPEQAESSAQLLWTDAQVSGGQAYVNYNHVPERSRSMAKGQKYITAFLYNGELSEDGTLTAGGDVSLERIDRGVYRMSMNGWNGGTVTYSSGGAVSTIQINAQLPELGSYASAEASSSGFISSFTVSESSNVFYLAFRDDKAVTLRRVTGVRIDPDVYSTYFTIEPVTEGQVYKVTVDPTFNQTYNGTATVSFFCHIDDIYGSRDVLSNVSISNSVVQPFWQP